MSADATVDGVTDMPTADATLDSSIDASAPDMPGPDVSIIVTPTLGLRTTEAGGTDTFSIVLSAMPTNDVVIGLASSNLDEGTVSPSSLTFTVANWNAPQTVTAAGVDDVVRDGAQSYTVLTAAAASTDERYNGLDADDVAVVNSDNESPGVTVNRTSGLLTTEAGGTDSFTVQLNVAPMADVTISLMSDTASEATVTPLSLTFTNENWSSAQTVTVTGVDDAIADGDAPFLIVTGDTVSTDADYGGIDVPDVVGENRDDESPGVIVSPTSSLTTSEAGGTAMFSVVLQSQPASDVTLPVASSDLSEGNVDVSMLTFTATNWNVPQAITVTGVDDAIADGDQMYSVTVGPATSTDPNYDTLAGDTVSVSNTDDESAGFVVAPTSGLITTEGGGTATFTVVLRSEPSANVMFAVTTEDASEGNVAPASLTFTTGNWSVAQAITITGVDDLIADGDQSYQVRVHVSGSADTNYAGLTDRLVDIINTDNETAGITVNPMTGLTTTEAGGTATFTVVLNSQPTADVTIALSSDVPLEGTVTPTSLTFTMANWNVAQTVTVTGEDDAIADGARVYHIVTGAASSADLNYNTLNPSDVTVTNTDNDSVGVTVSPTSGLTTTEAGATATFTMVLTSQPTANVSFNLMSSDTTEGTVSPASVMFTMSNWMVPQTVTVTGIDDLLADGNILYSIITGAGSSADSAYNGLNPSDVTVTNTDNDMASVIVMPAAGLMTSEAITSATFTVVLTAQPTANVTISLMSSDTTEGTVSPASLTFTMGNWSIVQTVTITGVDDSLDDGDVAYTILTGAAVSADSAYSGLPVSDVNVNNTDDDAAGITVSPTSGLVTTEAAGTAMFTVVLTSQPSASVVIGLTSSNLLEGTVAPASLTFTSMNWSTPQTVTVTGIDDLAADGNIAYTIVTASAVSTDLAYSGMNPSDVSITNNDNDAPGVTVSPTSGLMTSEALGTATCTIVLATMPSADVTISLMSTNTSEGTVSPASVTFTTMNWSTPQTVTVTGVNDSVDDGDVVYTIVTGNAVSTDGGYNGRVVSDVGVTNIDDDAAGVTVTPTSGLVTTEAGGMASFTVVLASQPTADVSISLTSSNTGEGNVSPASVTFTTMNWSMAQTVTVTGVNDSIDDGDVAYSIVTGTASSSDGTYNGMAVNDVTVANTDNDTAGVTVSPTSGLVTTEAGGTASFSVVLTSQPTASVSISLMSSNTAEGTVAPASITFTTMNWSMTQMVTITGVNDFVDDGDVAYSIITGAATSTDPVYSGHAVSDVSVSNTDNDTANILVLPTSGLVTTEVGGTATFTIVLSAEPTANVSVSVTSADTTEGTVSPASVTFTNLDWNIAQTITITGVDDFLDDGNIGYTITTGASASSDPIYSGRVVADVSVTNTDNDTAGITVTPTSGLVTTEAGGMATFTIVLDSQPTASVTVLLGSGDATEGTASLAFVTFTTANWSMTQTVTVTGVDDGIVDGSVMYNIVTSAASSGDASYSGMVVSDVSVTNSDNDSVGIVVSPTSGLNTSESGAAATFTVVLTSMPSANVSISLASSTVTEGTVSPASVTFLPGAWNTPQTVTVTGVDDVLFDGSVAYSIVTGASSSADGTYNGLVVSDVSVTNVDNEGDRCISCDGGGVTRGASYAFGVSNTGRYVSFWSTYAFAAGGTASGDAYVRDRQTGAISIVDVSSASVVSNAGGIAHHMSRDGRFVCFASNADNLVAGDSNGVSDTFLRDLTMGTTIRVSVSSAGVQGNNYSDNCAVSDDGRYVAFRSRASNLVASDTNGSEDCFLRDTVMNTTTRVNVTTAGAQATVAQVASVGMSSDGRYITFDNRSSLDAADTNGVVDVYVRDVMTNTTYLISQSSAGVVGANVSSEPRITADGRYVVFSSNANNLVASDTNAQPDVFVRDTMMSTTTRVSVTNAGAQATGSSARASISDDGRYVAFSSAAANIVSSDTNGVDDAFVRDRTLGTTILVSRSLMGAIQTGGGIPFLNPVMISPDGTAVVFATDGTNIIAADANGAMDIFAVTNP